MPGFLVRRHLTGQSPYRTGPQSRTRVGQGRSNWYRRTHQPPQPGPTPHQLPSIRQCPFRAAMPPVPAEAMDRRPR